MADSGTTETLNNAMDWVGRGLEAPPIQPACHGHGHLDETAPSPIRPSPEHFQGWGRGVSTQARRSHSKAVPVFLALIGSTEFPNLTSDPQILNRNAGYGLHEAALCFNVTL